MNERAQRIINDALQERAVQCIYFKRGAFTRAPKKLWRCNELVDNNWTRL